MRAIEVNRRALSLPLIFAFLSACGGSSVQPATDNAIAATSLKHHETFSYTGAKQKFIVPGGVTQLAVSAHGGAGSGFSVRIYNFPGLPGRVYAVIPVHPRDRLYVFVGGSGDDGGFNGGGAGQTGGGNGGGASDVRENGAMLKDRIIVAAGGGGSGAIAEYNFANGGNGGGLNGKDGDTACPQVAGGGGGGGSQRAGGAGGARGKGSHGNGHRGSKGMLGQGGDGGAGASGTIYDEGLGGGGGGGGYYGGGCGGGSARASEYYSCNDGGGGGGGSSYVERSAITSRTWTGWRATGDGRVVFSW